MQNNQDPLQSKYKLCNFCEECFERVSEISSSCLTDYIVTSDYYTGYQKPLKLYGKEEGHISETFKTLEEHGYVVTTETSDIMCCVKPVGYIKNDEFYACKRDHIA